MRLKILSDLHLEVPAAYDLYKIEPGDADALALLGDIGHVRDEGLFRFLSEQLRQFALVFFVLGNHEPYHNDWTSAVKRLVEFGDAVEQVQAQNPGLGKFVLLNRTRYDVSPSLTILGCTLFSQVLPEQRDHVSFGMNDFYHIRDWCVDQHCQYHLQDVTWLNEQVSAISRAEPHRKLVIFTHYSPTTDARAADQKHRGSNVTSGFSTNLSDCVCWTSASVCLWAFGHTHFNCDFEEQGKRICTNQRGYYFAQAAGFVENAMIQLE